MTSKSTHQPDPDQDPITYQGIVYPWHCDHMGHMNVMWYTGKFDEATWHFFAPIGITAAYLRDNDLGMAAVDQHIRYKAELLAGDLIIVRSQWLEVRDKSIRFCHRMYNSNTGILAATCELVSVHTNAKTRRAHEFDKSIIAKVEAALAGE